MKIVKYVITSNVCNKRKEESAVDIQKKIMELLIKKYVDVYFKS